MFRLTKGIVVLAAIAMVFATGQATAGEAAGGKKKAATSALNEVVKKVDAKIAYPRMKSLEADAESSWLKQQMENTPGTENVKLKFYWQRPDKSRFVVTGAPEAMADQAREVENMLGIWCDMVVTRRLASILKDYNATLKDEEKSWVIDARAKDPSSPFWSMKYTIDKESALPTKWYMSTNDWDADVTVKYQKMKSGKMRPIEWNAQANGTKVVSRVTLTKVGRRQLAETLTITFTSDDGTERTSTVKLSNHVVNKPIPEGMFPPEKE